MQTVAFSNLKGGAGKTTSAVSIADVLACHGAAVLFVDLDPQGTASAWMASRSPACRHLLTSGFDPSEHVRTVEADTHGPSGGRLDIVTADRSLERANERRASDLASRLERLWKGSERAYDVALVDTPPQASGLVTAALMSTAAILAPVAPGRGAVDGLKHVLEYTSRIGGAEVRASFACNVDLRSKLHRRISPQLIERLGPLSDGGRAAAHFVRSTVQMQEAEAAGELPCIYAPGSTAWKDYRALSDELAPVLGVDLEVDEEGSVVSEEDLADYRAAVSS
jgi:chromosome partitioning protein